MGTINNIKQQSNESDECDTCLIGFAWAETVTCDPVEIVYRPIYKFWPPTPYNVWPEYDSFETADAYVNPPDWDKEQTQSLSPDCTISYSEPYACVAAATNVKHASGPKVEREETFSHVEVLNVDFYWYGARPNPLYPGTAGAPPYIRELVGPITVERNRRVYYIKEKTIDIYGGRIQCTCGEPSECGCS